VAGRRRKSQRRARFIRRAQTVQGGGNASPDLKSLDVERRKGGVGSSEGVT